MTLSASLRRRFQWKSALLILTLITLCLSLLTYTRGEKSGHHQLPVKVGNRPRVVLRQGRFVGVELEEDYPQIMDAFLGIPYGLSTEGLGRFKAPVGVNASESEFDAGDFGDRCPSGGGRGESENCLNLNLYRPKKKDTARKLPVVVYIHGGAYNGGIGDSPWQLSHFAAWSAEPMIAVSFSYRVGALGFLPSKFMATEGLLNAGLKDQELLLEWVQENIAAFGGDPENVTLMGVSAGAHSIGHHLLHNTDKPPPFARVILESGAATARAVYTYSNPLHEKQFKAFLVELGCASVPDKRLLTTLRSYSTYKISSASGKIFNRFNPSMQWPFQPVIDGPGGMIPIRPIDAWKAGKWHNVSILTGYNTNEGSTFVPTSGQNNKDFTKFFTTLLPGFRKRDIAALQDVYSDPATDSHSKYVEKRPGFGAQFSRMEQAYGHFAYIAPVRQTVHYAATGIAPVYLYHFAAESSARGAAHGDHIPFVMHTPGVKDESPTVKDISGHMHAYWTSFITSGDPNAVPGRYKERRKWPRYERAGGEDGKGRKGGDGRLLVFGEGNDEVAGGREKGVVVQLKDDGFAAEESEFWWNRTELFEF
ncbi:related to cholinesterase [Rhynchosporium agropyri]|uniref:Carboxylic ester hydrolase n=1 Tax=Rhynchosporium agropyri TaxID=914238 RepID=A0A1E1KRB1_9HELO|nr:related to cholinesterase [Rhynchosporium agropyri]